MSYDIYKIKGSELIDEKVRNKITDIKNVAKSGSYKDLDLTGATINTNYTLPNSSNSVIGGVKLGEGLKIDNHGRLGEAHTIDLSLHKTSIQLTKDRHQIIDVVDGDTIILPTIDNEELLIIDVKIEIPWNGEHKSPSVTFPTDIKWVESPRLKFDSWYDYTFIYVKGEWLGSFVEYSTVYDSSMNMFVFDTTKTPEDKTVTLSTNRRGDSTNWDGVTDWGDGVIDNNTSHTYTNDGIYLVKTKYILSQSNNGNNNTKKKLIDCININKNITDLSDMFSWCINIVEFTNSSKWNTSNVTNMWAMFYNCNKLITLDVSNFNTNNVTDMGYMFQNCNNLTTLNVSNFDTTNVTAMINMFYGCNSLTTLDVSNFNTNNVTNMGSMFSGCNNLTTLDVSNWNITNVTSMDNMFNGCRSLTVLDVSNWNTNNVTNMSAMFNGCNKLTTLDVSNFNTDKVTNMGWMFNGCNNLTTLDVSNFNTNKVTNMNSMFNGCNKLTSLDVSNFNTNNVTDISYMFNGCNKLTTLDVSNFNTSNTTSMTNMFRECNSLTTLDVSNFNTTKVTNMNGMFNNCNKLTTLDISNFNMDNVTTYKDMFTNCTSLHQSGLTMTNCNDATKTKINAMVQA